MMVSVDGFIEGKNPEEYWHNWNEEMSDYMVDFFSKVDTFIYGRKAYEDMIAYWPSLNDDFAKVMNQTPKLVFSKSLKSVTWNSTLLDEVNPVEMQELKNKDGKDMVIFAGADIVKSFMEHDLVDEFRLLVNPLLLGNGKSYFNGIGETTLLNLKSVKRFDCGNVLLIYNPKQN